MNVCGDSREEESRALTGEDTDDEKENETDAGLPEKKGGSGPK